MTPIFDLTTTSINHFILKRFVNVLQFLFWDMLDLDLCEKAFLNAFHAQMCWVRFIFYPKPKCLLKIRKWKRCIRVVHSTNWIKIVCYVWRHCMIKKFQNTSYNIAYVKNHIFLLKFQIRATYLISIKNSGLTEVMWYEKRSKLIFLLIMDIN